MAARCSFCGATSSMIGTRYHHMTEAMQTRVVAVIAERLLCICCARQPIDDLGGQRRLFPAFNWVQPAGQQARPDEGRMEGRAGLTG